MERTIIIDGKEVRLRASAAIPRLYRLKFHRDIIQDMQTIGREIKKARAQADIQESDTAVLYADDAAVLEAAREPEVPPEEPTEIPRADQAGEPEQEPVAVSVSIPLEALTMFENVAYLMAKHADPQGVPSSPDEWLDGFDTFSIYRVFPVIQEMWSANLKTLNKPVKK